MNNKQKFLALSVAIPLLGAGVFLTNTASAFGGFGGMTQTNTDQYVTQTQNMFQSEADLLGISVDEVKTAWTAGKGLRELAKEKGITDAQLKTKIAAKRNDQMKAQLAALVTKGVITQAQADARLAYVVAHPEAKMHGGRGGHRGGKMMGIMAPVATPSVTQ